MQDVPEEYDVITLNLEADGVKLVVVGQHENFMRHLLLHPLREIGWRLAVLLRPGGWRNQHSHQQNCGHQVFQVCCLPFKFSVSQTGYQQYGLLTKELLWIILCLCCRCLEDASVSPPLCAFS